MKTAGGVRTRLNPPLHHRARTHSPFEVCLMMAIMAVKVMTKEVASEMVAPVTVVKGYIERR